MTDEVLDVLIVGAGLAGIGAAVRLKRALPHLRYLLSESRTVTGGTWDLFRYPGVRSDTDMYTLGYRTRPWQDTRRMLDGPSILRYLRETVDEQGLADRMAFGERVIATDWSSDTQCWTVTFRRLADESLFTRRARFLHLCTGYYHYDQGYRPSFPNEECYRGRLIHPQHWPEDLDYSGQRIVVIGSGATAMTLVPALARRAAHVTLLQRSPTYVATQPLHDPLARFLEPWLPRALAYRLVRWKCIVVGQSLYAFARWRPERVRRQILAMARAALPPGYDVERHFAPRYQPWDERICAVADDDLFREIRAGRVSMVTDTIRRFVPEGIETDSGEILPADLIVTATGLRVLPLGGIEISVDGRRVSLPETMVYRGAMLSGVPNLVTTFGYTNASWTLRAELISTYVCRLLAYLERHGFRSAIADRDPSVGERPFLDFTSGYVKRALPGLPKQGDRFPWRVHQNYLKDFLVTYFKPLRDGTLRFQK